MAAANMLMLRMITSLTSDGFRPPLHFALEHDLFRKTGSHFSGSCSRSGLTQIVILQRQRADALAGRRKQCIAECWCDHRHRRLAAARPESAARHEDGLDLRHRSHAEHLIVVEIRLLDAAFLDGNLTIERGRESIDHPALDL